MCVHICVLFLLDEDLEANSDGWILSAWMRLEVDEILQLPFIVTEIIKTYQYKDWYEGFVLSTQSVARTGIWKFAGFGGTFLFSFTQVLSIFNPLFF